MNEAPLNPSGFGAKFRDTAGNVVQGQQAVIPICRYVDCRALEFIGTGFFISASGIFATAAHVVDEFYEKAHPDEDALVTFVFVPPDKLHMRPILKVTKHTVADVAIGAVATEFDVEGRAIRNKCLPLTTDVPPLGAQVASWAYPRVRSENHKATQTVFIAPSLMVGKVIEEHREGRDRVMLPGACYMTDLDIDGGASGGPVFDEAGRVFAVNSTGFDGTNIGYVSHIQKIGGLPLAKYLDAEGSLHDNIYISDLIARGEIIVQNRESEVVHDPGTGAPAVQAINAVEFRP